MILDQSIVGRGVLTPLFCEDALILPTSFFKFCPLPPSLSPPNPTPTAFFGWIGDCATFDVLFYLIILWIYRFQINVSWFGKYNTFFIFHDSFSHLPRKSWYQKSFCFLNQETKTNFFLAFRLKTILMWCVSCFLLKQWCCCHLNIRFFSLI